MRDIQEKLVFSVFIGIIFCPIILSLILFTTGIKLDTTLKGYFDSVSLPSPSMDAYVAGDYQTDYEEWLNANLLPRGMFIKLYNQIEFSCFNLGNRVIGKNKNIFEYGYIADALALDEYNYMNPQKQAELNDYVNHLISIQSKLKKHDKYLVIYFTPSKAVHEFDDIPLQYTVRQENQTLRAADYLKELIQQTNIPFFDSTNLVNSDNYPAFYPTGIHWSRPIEQETSYALIDILKEVSGKNLRNIRITDLVAGNNPYWRDTDVYDLLNLYSSYPNITYYEYNTQREYPKSYDKVRILLQGGSFAQGLKQDYFSLYGNDILSYINYNHYIIDETGNKQILQEWNDLNLSTYLDKTDFVIIELQESHVKDYSYGFVTYLDSYLDSYIPNKSQLIKYDHVLDTILKPELTTGKGFWSYEESHIWAKSSCSITLNNPNISTNGLTIEIGVPEQSMPQGSTTLHIYVNQELIDTISVSNTQIQKLNYPAEIFTNSRNIYEIEIYCEDSFIPKELGMNQDSRELSFTLYYIGDTR